MDKKELAKKIKYAFRFMPDRIYLQIYYFLKFKKFCDFKNPRTFNEKLQWLKLNDRRPEYTKMVDKYEVKKYVASIIGEEYIIPTLGVWDSFDEIDFDALPDRFVLKCTHDSGSQVIVRDKAGFDIAAARKKIRAALKYNFYYIGREWPYKNVKPRIIAEQYLEDVSEGKLNDYRVFSFGGEPHIIEVDYDKFVEYKRNLYTTEWEYIEAQIQYPTLKDKRIERPLQLKEMLKLTRTLSKGFHHVRTDFYNIEDKLYFGELTFYHASGFQKFIPEQFGVDMGNWLKIGGGGYLIVGTGYILYLRFRNDKRIVYGNSDIRDYKLMCFNGKVRASFACTGRSSKETLQVTFYDMSWKRLHFERRYPASKIEIEKPVSFEKMVELAEKLSADIPFARIDFYEVEGRIFFGEITFYPGNGTEEFTPVEWDYKLGSWIELPTKASKYTLT